MNVKYAVVFISLVNLVVFLKLPTYAQALGLALFFPCRCTSWTSLQRAHCLLPPSHSPWKGTQPGLRLIAVGRAGWLSLLPQNGGGAAAGVSGRHPEDFFCLWKYSNLSSQGTCSVIFFSLRFCRSE